MQQFDAFKIQSIIKIIQAEKVADKNGVKRSNVGGFFKAINHTAKGRRIWNCRLGVSKEVTGAGLRYDPESRDNMIVYDNFAKVNKYCPTKYRTIKVVTLEFLQVRGRVLIRDGKKTDAYMKYENTLAIAKRLRNK